MELLEDEELDDELLLDDDELEEDEISGAFSVVEPRAPPDVKDVPMSGIRGRLASISLGTNCLFDVMGVAISTLPVSP